MENYTYTFTYQNGDVTLTKTMSAMTNLDELKEELRLFLLGCSWPHDSLQFLEETDE